MKKRIITTILAIGMTMSMVACGQKNSLPEKTEYGVNNTYENAQPEQKTIDVNDPYGFAINGVTYTCPMLFRDFIGDGSNIYYKCKSDDRYKEPWQDVEIYDKATGQKIANAYLRYDNYKQEHELEDEYLYRIVFKMEELKKTNVSVNFYRGLKMGSTPEEVNAAYGQAKGSSRDGEWTDILGEGLRGSVVYAKSNENAGLYFMDINHVTMEMISAMGN